MAISEADFDNEDELHQWAATNLSVFLPNALFLPGFQVTTTSGKKGIPDGFAFNFHEREWFVIESELLNHGVWPHIAEQIVRFVVAMQNSDTRRKIRDRLFEHILTSKQIESTAKVLETSPERLLQQLELFIEGISPEVVIFIDDTNQDLHDMAQALLSSIRVFRIQKFIVDGRPEYHSPDRHIPILVTESADNASMPETEYGIVELLGGGQLETRYRRFKSYRIFDGMTIHIKRSKFYINDNYYWYGVNASTLAHFDEFSVSHVVFVMGDEGRAVVPLDVVKEFVKHTKTSRNADGSIRHYHVLISSAPNPELYWSNEAPRFDLTEHYRSF